MKPIKREVILLFDYFSLHEIDKTPTMCDIESHLSRGERKKVPSSKLQIIIREMKQTECYQNNEGVDRFLTKMKKYSHIPKLREHKKKMWTKTDQGLSEAQHLNGVDGVGTTNLSEAKLTQEDPEPAEPAEPTEPTAPNEDDDDNDVESDIDDDMDSIFDDFVIQGEFDDFCTEMRAQLEKMSSLALNIDSISCRIDVKFSELDRALQQIDKVIENLSMIQVPEPPSKSLTTPANDGLRKLFRLRD